MFTLIQKFRTDRRASAIPCSPTAGDIIVITDEAHRSQYDTFALNMRNALPNAAFIGFTGTPLMVGEEKTRQVFGDYVSIYNFRESVDDQATVPLYYENRIPELQLTNADLNEDMETAARRGRAGRGPGSQTGARVRPRVLHHHPRRPPGDSGQGHREPLHGPRVPGQGHGRLHRQGHRRADVRQGAGSTGTRGLEELRAQLAPTTDAEGRAETRSAGSPTWKRPTWPWWSPSPRTRSRPDKKGVDIVPHRKRMVNEDLDKKFKNPIDPFRLVFVCAMWMTGFDVPSCSTIYLDKPMRNHTLMQTIARANRVFGDKENGLIVDYVGIFRNLEKALAIYGTGSGGRVELGDSPVADKSKLVDELRKALSAAADFCRGAGFEPEAIRLAAGLEKLALLTQAVDAVLSSDESKREFLALAGRTLLLYRAILPDPVANDLAADCALFAVMVERIRSLAPQPDISAVEQQVVELLEDSIEAQGYTIEPSDGADASAVGGPVDLSKIDFDALREKFAGAQKHIEAEKLRGALGSKLTQMVRVNRSRLDYQQKFEELIAEYNNGALNIEELFTQLVDFAQSLSARGAACHPGRADRRRTGPI